MKKLGYIILAIICGFLFATVGVWLLGVLFTLFGVVFVMSFKLIGFFIMLLIYFLIGRFILNRINK